MRATIIGGVRINSQTQGQKHVQVQGLDGRATMSGRFMKRS